MAFNQRGSRGGFGRQKYRNKPCWYDGKYFQSELERDVYIWLRILEDAKAIFNLEHQVRYTLHALDGSKVCDHLPDFRYTDGVTGKVTLIEAKGKRTTEYNMKVKLLLGEYPDVVHQEIFKKDLDRINKRRQ